MTAAASQAHEGDVPDKLLIVRDVIKDLCREMVLLATNYGERQALSRQIIFQCEKLYNEFPDYLLWYGQYWSAAKFQRNIGEPTEPEHDHIRRRSRL